LHGCEELSGPGLKHTHMTKKEKKKALIKMES